MSDRRNRRSLNGTIVLHVPASVIKAKSTLYLSRGKPACRNSMVNEADYSIVGRFGAEYRGHSSSTTCSPVTSSGFTGCAGSWRHPCSRRWPASTARGVNAVSKMAARHKAKIDTPHGPRTCFEARVERTGKNPLVARFGGIPLKRQKLAVLTDRLSTGPVYPNKELIRRLLAGRCELCGRADVIEVHHIRNLAQLNRLGQPSPPWAQAMAKRRRKSLVVCGGCHGLIHGEPASLTA